MRPGRGVGTEVPGGTSEGRRLRGVDLCVVWAVEVLIARPCRRGQTRPSAVVPGGAGSAVRHVLTVGVGVHGAGRAGDGSNRSCRIKQFREFALGF